MKLKQLQSLLQDIEPFEEPKIELEQYPTGAHLASNFLFAVESKFEELEGCTVLDLGCGTGMLSIGAAVMGAATVTGVDVDEDALCVAQRNMTQFEDDLPIDLIHCDVRQIAAQSRLKADTILMNPPFGTRRKGADMEFLEAAFKLSTNSIYSLNKTSTRAYIEKTALKTFGAASAEVVAELRYDLPASYKFHKYSPQPSLALCQASVILSFLAVSLFAWHIIHWQCVPDTNKSCAAFPSPPLLLIRREKSKDIQVDVWRFEVPDAE